MPCAFASTVFVFFLGFANSSCHQYFVNIVAKQNGRPGDRFATSVFPQIPCKKCKSFLQAPNKKAASEFGERPCMQKARDFRQHLENSPRFYNLVQSGKNDKTYASGVYASVVLHDTENHGLTSLRP